MPVEILIDENDTINAMVEADGISVEIIANVIRQGDTMVLDRLHVEKISYGPLGQWAVKK